MRATSSVPKYSRRRRPNALARAWLALLALSVASALMTVLTVSPKLSGAGILTLALVKCWIIFAHYLDLAASPAWLRGFVSVLTIFVITIFALYLI